MPTLFRSSYFLLTSCQSSLYLHLPESDLVWVVSNIQAAKSIGLGLLVPSLLGVSSAGHNGSAPLHQSLLLLMRCRSWHLSSHIPTEPFQTLLAPLSLFPTSKCYNFPGCLAPQTLFLMISLSPMSLISIKTVWKGWSIRKVDNHCSQGLVTQD